MKYMGSKARHAKEILEAVREEVGVFAPYTNWVEPFVGGANMIDKVPTAMNRYGNDSNKYLITMFQAIQKGWVPPDEISEEKYKFLMYRQNDIDEALIAFVGIGCSYSGKWFGGYARGNDNKGKPRNYCLESKKNLLSQNLTDIVFTSGSYEDMDILPNSIIYCDPPYAGTTKYKDHFDHDKFWDWCDQQVSKGQKVFVSEYNAPEGWRCIWQKEVNNSLTKETGSKRGTEKLFTK